VDTLDIAIINLMIADARIPFSNVAKKLNVTTDTISRRYKKLVKNGIIEKTSITIDLPRCGMEYMIYFFIKTLSEASIPKMFQVLANTENVTIVSKLMGEYSFFVQGVLIDLEQQDKFVRTVSEIPGVKEIEFYISSGQKECPFVFYYSTPFRFHPVKQSGF
jgi:Lrp/AsnC family transcriptional regulator for asnA, asnC and gidA